MNNASVRGAEGLGPIVQTSSKFARKLRSTTIYLASRAPGKPGNLKQYQRVGDSSGRTTEQYAGQINNPIRFQGQYFDAETGLHYNRYRYYDAHAGKFVGQDPIGIDAGENIYEYASNTAGWIDPLGLTRSSAGRQQRLRDILEDPKTPKHIKGWIKQEINAIQSRGKNKRGNARKRIRVPPGYDMAHWRGYESAKGYDYRFTDLNLERLRTVQHQLDNGGRKNPEGGSGKGCGMKK